MGRDGGGSEFLPILQKNKSNRGKVFVCEIQTAECVTYRGGGGVMRWGGKQEHQMFFDVNNGIYY